MHWIGGVGVDQIRLGCQKSYVFDYAARRRTLRFVLLYSKANINLQQRTRRMLWGKQRKALVICDRNPSTAAAAAAAERLT